MMRSSARRSGDFGGSDVTEQRRVTEIHHGLPLEHLPDLHSKSLERRVKPTETPGKGPKSGATSWSARPFYCWPGLRIARGAGAANYWNARLP